MRIGRRPPGWVAVALATILAAGPAVVPAPAYAASHARIEGSGSSWAANAVTQWIGDVDSQGLQVVFTPSGSAQGRKDYGLKTVDYAVSDIPFQGRDPISGDDDSALGRPYVYLPITAGGTAFPYQIRVGGKLVTNLRLSTRTLAQIFTNQITNWNDSQIAADNNGRRLPNLPIVPVVHSEGSGSTAMLTRFFSKQYHDIWKSYSGLDGQTEYWPQKSGTKTVLQNGSDGVMNFVASAAANGAIGYDEYSYALNKNHWPVAKLENSANYFTLPDQYNVAKSLTQAVINMDKNSKEYLIQNLDKVYTYSDPRTYPLSSYSYMVLPIGTDAQDSRMSTAKRQTLTDFLYYSICTGQREMGPIGYSPLPVNLVQAGFDQIQKLKAADPGVDIARRDVSTCNNPTFIKGNPNGNYLAQIAPMPASCDKAGAGPCGTTTSRTGGGGGAAGAGGAGPNASASASAATHVDPDTGQVVQGDARGGGDAEANQLAAARTNDLTGVLAPIAVLELLAVLLVPAVLGRRRRREGP